MKWSSFLAALILASAAYAAPPSTNPAGADAALQEIKSMTPPTLDQSKREDQAYIREFVTQRNNFEQKRAEKMAEFYKNFPDHPEAMPMLLQGWTTMARMGKSDEVMTQTDQFLKDHPDSPKRDDVLYTRGIAAMMDSMRNPGKSAKAVAVVDEFVKAAPKDPRGADLLSQLASSERDVTKKAELRKRIVENYPDSRAAKFMLGEARQTEAIGKPFDLAFTDAISGRQIDFQKDLKGKVVVVDFWATWCGPCVGEMPHMKELYSQYKDKGVEFVGISLDQPEAQGGLDKLKSFVAQNQIGWPQYYQGKGWDSDFSSGWGINSIPRVFIVDAEGKLASTEARGQLEKLIPELLAKREKTASAQ